MRTQLDDLKDKRRRLEAGMVILGAQGLQRSDQYKNYVTELEEVNTLINNLQWI